MIVKVGRFNYWCDETGEKISLKITNWESPFGVESYLKKNIINFKIPNNNEGYNLTSIISQIENEIKTSFGLETNTPIKNRGEDFLRVELSKDSIISEEKPLILSGVFEFRVYQWKGTWGISVIFEKIDL